MYEHEKILQMNELSFSSPCIHTPVALLLPNTRTDDDDDDDDQLSVFY